MIILPATIVPSPSPIPSGVELKSTVLSGMPAGIGSGVLRSLRRDSTVYVKATYKHISQTMLSHTELVHKQRGEPFGAKRCK